MHGKTSERAHQRTRSVLILLVCFTAISMPIGGVEAGEDQLAPTVDDTATCRIGAGSLAAYVGTVSLPADGVWRIQSHPHLDAIRELYLIPTNPAELRQLGKRMYAAIEERQIQRDRWAVQIGYEAARQYAQENDGVGPESISDLSKEKRWERASQRWGKPIYRSNEITDFVTDSDEGPFLHLIPNVPFQFAEPEPATNADEASTRADERRSVEKENRELLAFELRPFIDDGQHWVLYTDGECERIEISSDRCEKYDVTIRPMLTDASFNRSKAPQISYKIVLISEVPMSGSSQLKTFNQVLDQECSIHWDFDAATSQPYSDLRQSLSDAREFAWRPYQQAARGGVLSAWSQGGETAANETGRGRNLSMFSVLGGRAAIEETLQLQNLVVSGSESKATVDVDSLKGVEVKSHPFEEMLDGQPGGRLEMADVVPADRFFVYIGKPESISAMLDRGAPFIATAGATLTGNKLKYNLESKYLARLGMTRDWVDAVLASGLTSEMALFAPDLFFIDGTDVTVVARLTQPRLFQKLLNLLGASGLTSNQILEIPTATGGSAFLTLRDDLLFASTSRSELQQSIDLHIAQGKGSLEQNSLGQSSLGASAEFRYMLTQLPVNEQTRIYAYFSDPFVRRLVGPRVKLGQRRRMIAKAKMEALTSRVLLARLDGHPEPHSIPELVKSEHLKKAWQTDGVSVAESGLVRSERYGTLPHMRTLPEVPLEKVTPEEAEAYRRYVENYGRYWRRFFDPIAIRLDEAEANQLELTTFILPLVDNSIYNGLRAVLAHQDDATSLSIPVVEPTPVAQFSANLKEEAWQQVAGSFGATFARYSGVSSAMMDDFGPGVHVAIFDADPIIAMGSGDLFGAFGGSVIRGNGSQMMMAPVALSMLTRPCSIMIETTSPEKTARYLRQAAFNGLSRDRRRGGFASSFYQVNDRDEWVWSIDLFGMVKLRYGVEVVGKYLVIRNIPWTSDDKVVSVAPATLNAALLQAKPSACKEQLAGLFAVASDANRRAAMGALGRLYPFMLIGSPSVEKAAAEHQRLFGFYPQRSEGDRWKWADFRLVSDDFGDPTRERQPAFDPQRPFGLMNRIDSMELNMQFEDDGLRSTIRWRLR